jgi:(1->4)-alpha-D-glucan 1-alpha-D-glucosylmutase
VTEQGPVSDHDRRYIVQAVGEAKRRAPAVTRVVFDFIERLLLKETPIASREECEDRARFIGKFQQITGPVAAKGIEDTALYIYNRLLSLNEVGSDAMQFGLEPATVHTWLSERNRRWPHALSTTSTHDTKRGEDVRARLNVLSEIPGAWKDAVTRWRALNRRFKSEVRGTYAPGANEEYLLYQTLVGAWPFDAGSEEGLGRFRERIDAFMMKALREAKVHTSWLSADEPYEAAVRRFVESILDRRRSAPFLEAFERFHKRVAEFGIYNSLAQLLIKVTAPGVPDFYQGAELWDLNLVDPDNRRPVDYEARCRILATLQCDLSDLPPETLLKHRHDGRVKVFATTRALAARTRWREVYERGDYIPLPTKGACRDSVFAFARRFGDLTTITCVPRLIASVIPDATAPPLGPVWLDTRIDLPFSAAPADRVRFRDAFTGAVVEPTTADGALTISAATLFSRFPVALLCPCAI